jgi:hypothetical protein
MADGIQRDWRERCFAVSNETDPLELCWLVQDLIKALDKSGRSWRHPVFPSGAIPTNQRAAEEGLHG